MWAQRQVLENKHKLEHVSIVPRPGLRASLYNPHNSCVSSLVSLIEITNRGQKGPNSAHEAVFDLHMVVCDNFAHQYLRLEITAKSTRAGMMK